MGSLGGVKGRICGRFGWSLWEKDFTVQLVDYTRYENL